MKQKGELMRLIDADELLRKLEEYFNKKEQDAIFTGNRGSGVSWNDAIYYIKTAPSVQPEQSCKFCEYARCVGGSRCRYEGKERCG